MTTVNGHDRSFHHPPPLITGPAAATNGVARSGRAGLRNSSARRGDRDYAKWGNADG